MRTTTCAKAALVPNSAVAAKASIHFFINNLSLVRASWLNHSLAEPARYPSAGDRLRVRSTNSKSQHRNHLRL
jgi:hypothetical protein